MQPREWRVRRALRQLASCGWPRGSAKREFGAHAIGEGRAMGEALGCDQRRDPHQALGTGNGLENAMLLLHISLRTDPV